MSLDRSKIGFKFILKRFFTSYLHIKATYSSKMGRSNDSRPITVIDINIERNVDVSGAACENDCQSDSTASSDAKNPL